MLWIRFTWIEWMWDKHTHFWFPDLLLGSGLPVQSQHTQNPGSQHTLCSADVRDYTLSYRGRGREGEQAACTQYHHITFISTGGKFSPIAQSHLVCNKQINRDAQTAIMYVNKQPAQLYIFSASRASFSFLPIQQGPPLQCGPTCCQQLHR